MRSRLLVVTALICICFGAFATPYRAWWDAGNRMYNARQYDSAAWYFEQIAALQPKEAVVYYNLGNSYYRLNKIGASVLNYRKALKADLTYQQAADNLALAESRILKPIPKAEDIFFLRWWKGITAESHTGLWSVISLVLFLVVIAIALLKVLGKISFATGRIQALLLVLWGLTLALAFCAAARGNATSGVVMEEGTPLLTDKQGKVIIAIPEGTTLDVVQESGDMLEVTLPDGRTGWVSKSTVAII